MNELLNPEFEVLLDYVPASDRHRVADLMDRVEQFETGDFTHSIDYLDLFTAIRRENESGFIRALTSLLRIVRYLAELARVAACDSTKLGDST